MIKQDITFPEIHPREYDQEEANFKTVQDIDREKQFIGHLVREQFDFRDPCLNISKIWIFFEHLSIALQTLVKFTE